MSVDFGSMTFDEIDTMPTKPSTRKAKASPFSSTIDAMLKSGKARVTKALDNGGGSMDRDSEASKVDRELRRAAKMAGANITIRKSRISDDNLVTLSFSVKADPKAQNGEPEQDEQETAAQDEVTPRARKRSA